MMTSLESAGREHPVYFMTGTLRIKQNLMCWKTYNAVCLDMSVTYVIMLCIHVEDCKYYSPNCSLKVAYVLTEIRK